MMPFGHSPIGTFARASRWFKPFGQMMYPSGMMLPSAMMCALRHMGKHRIIANIVRNIISASAETSLAAIGGNII